MTRNSPEPGKEAAQAYETVARAIRFVRAHAQEQPGLERIAAHVGVSPHHFQRVFSRFAGISPKRFLQFLTKEGARELLRRSRDVLTVSAEAGLSGPGRLHDLMVAAEAMTPGEVKLLGAGLTIRHGFADTAVGRILAGVTDRGVCHLRFVSPGGEAAALEELRAEWPRAVLVPSEAAAREVGRVVERAVAGGTAAGPESPPYPGSHAGTHTGPNSGTDAGPGGTPGKPLSLLLRGTNFQIKVWEALLRVPAGELRSYREVAESLGAPRASRAVGSALAANRIAVLIPCHRVIREDGDLGGFRWGLERKGALIGLEQGNRLESA
jgi:AraC family transcriptional regulator of adaptative response/methylated-DNA-[protein]-cysteine methyltransferase